MSLTRSKYRNISKILKCRIWIEKIHCVQSFWNSSLASSPRQMIESELLESVIYIYILESTLHQRVQFKFREVGYTASFLPVAFTPSRQPVPLPFVPFLAPYARFYGLPSKFAPSSRSMKLVSRFLGEGRPRYVAVQFPATFYVVFCSDRKKRKKKNREKYILHRYLSKRVRILFRAGLEHTWWLVTKFSSL